MTAARNTIAAILRKAANPKRHCALRWHLLLALLVVAVAAHAATRMRFIPAGNADYVYAGRVDFSDPSAPAFYWAGNSATIAFTGSRLDVALDAPDGNVYFDVIVDGDGAHRHVIRCEKGRHVYPIAEHLPGTVHTVEVFRRVDPTYPVARFDGIEIAATGHVLAPPAHATLRIVFYGDSITSGYGVLDPGRKDEGAAGYMDNYAAYDAVAARALGADYRSISLSGIGVMKSWFPLVMPQLYDRLQPRDPASRWDFSRWTPDFVVVNLLQNDSWLLPRERHPPTPDRIVAAYARFVRTLRSHYPHAYIICMLGDMDATSAGSVWPGYVRAAVRSLRARGDRKVYALIVPFKGTPGHPDVAEQRALAQPLIREIRALSESAPRVRRHAAAGGRTHVAATARPPHADARGHALEGRH